MIEQDTVKLLRECDAGVKMGLASINDVVNYARADGLRRKLTACRAEHEKLEREIRSRLDRFHDDGKEPNPMARGMSWLKTNTKLIMDDSDRVCADLITEGCNMGAKSVQKYINQYAAADKDAKIKAEELIRIEEKLVCDLKPYL